MHGSGENRRAELESLTPPSRCRSDCRAHLCRGQRAAGHGARAAGDGQSGARHLHVNGRRARRRHLHRFGLHERVHHRRVVTNAAAVPVSAVKGATASINFCCSLSKSSVGSTTMPARPMSISIYLIIALSARSCYDLRVTPSRSLIEDDWPVIRRLLPDDLEQSARERGAMRRRRGQVNSAEQLLRLILMHVAGGLSLEQTVTRAQARGLATLNAMALHKRLCTSRRWLEALTGHLLADIKPHLRQNEDCWGIGRRVRILDATDIQEPGSTGSDWRIHYSLRLPEMCCDFFELTDYHGAESLRRLPVEPGDLVLVDRGYNDRKAVGQILECGGELIMRYNSGAFPLLNAAGQSLDPLKNLP